MDPKMDRFQRTFIFKGNLQKWKELVPLHFQDNGFNFFFLRIKQFAASAELYNLHIQSELLT